MRNPVNRVVLARAGQLQAPDWWLTAAGAVFQTVWNVLDGRDPAAGIGDYDLFYFDEPTCPGKAEDAVIGRAADLFGASTQSSKSATKPRVHLWYEQHFGVPAKQFTSSREAIDHFASTTCCHAITQDQFGRLQAYAPHGYDNLRL